MRYFLLLMFLGAALAHKSYRGYQVYTSRPVLRDEMHQVRELTKDTSFDFWSTPYVGRPLRIMVAPEDVTRLVRTLNALGLQPELQVPDVGEMLEREKVVKVKRGKFEMRELNFSRYMEYDEIMDYLDDITTYYPSLVTDLVLANSTENREVRAVKLSTGPGTKETVWIDCAIHAREWLSPPVCLGMIADFLANPGQYETFDLVILPVANPDGYVYTWTSDRFWRKTRRVNPGSNCIGTDPNRNFDFLWNTDNNTDTCSETFPGSMPFSEPECAGINSWLIQNVADTFLYIAVHSYGQLILYPWGHTTEPAPNQAALQAAGDVAANTIFSYHNNRYDVGPSGESLYFTYGASDDYAYSNGVPYAYTFELPPTQANPGFDPPPSVIQPTVVETVAGINAMIRYILILGTTMRPDPTPTPTPGPTTSTTNIFTKMP